MKTAEQLQRNIMRRIYVAFGLRVALHPLTVLASAGVGVLYTLSRLVFVERVTDSLLSTPLGQVPAHAFSIVVHADWPTLVALLVFVLVCAAFMRQLARLRHVSVSLRRLAV